MAEEFNRRRTLLSDGLQSIPELELLPPEGAFYAFPDASAWGLDSMTLCNRLLEEGSPSATTAASASPAPPPNPPCWMAWSGCGGSRRASEPRTGRAQLPDGVNLMA
jgi:hypothetical protein